MQPPRTLYRKLVDSHTVKALDAQNVLLFCDLHLMNEYTSPQAFAGLHERGAGVPVPGQNVAVVSHVIPTHPGKDRIIFNPAAALQASNLKRNCDRHAIPLFDTDDVLQGIEHVLATQTLVYRTADDMRIRVDGRLSLGTSAKDLILMIIRRIGATGAGGHVVEFCGPAIEALSIEGRFTLCNMTVEAGARGALIAPDDKTVDYVLQRAPDLVGEWREQALAHWATLRSDDGAAFHVEHRFDAADVAPYVTWGTSPDQAIPIDGTVPTLAEAAEGVARQSAERALRYTGVAAGAPIEGLAVDHVFIGSCTNARIEDLRSVAAVVGDRHVAPGVRAMVVPASGAIHDQAEAEGIAAKLIAAGFEWRQPGCSMCLAMNDDVLAAGQRCASTTNRNFEGRQGRDAITHLMSPAMAAAAAVTGRITDVRKLETTHV